MRLQKRIVKLRNINALGMKLLVLAVLLCGIIFLYVSEIGCVWRYFFGIPCPGCGMTRAYIALLHLDIRRAFYFHAMFWSVPVLLLYVLFDGKLFSNAKINSGVLILIAAGFIVNYITKWI